MVAFCQSIQRPPPFIHPPNDPGFVNLIVRSRDRGRTWDAPRVAPDYGWRGVETPGIAQLSTGEVLLNQWRFAWYPLEMGRKLWDEGVCACFVVDPETLHWRPVRDKTDWVRHPLPYVRADGGAYVHSSYDNGYTWAYTAAIPIAPYQAAFSPKGAIELRNGDVLLALGSHEHDPLAASVVVRSTDRGHSWQPPVEAARVPGRILSEPSLVETTRGTLLLLSREEVTGYIYQSESNDGGYTWQPARALACWGYPTHAICLADGRLLMVFGRRRPPYGIRGALSEDAGKSWGPEFVICPIDHESNQGLNLGYPSVIEYAPGKLFTAFYAEDADGTPSIQGLEFSV
ncbi:MAG: exo-alpha-sialidase [Caldilineaceae bacterium]|nr:exo-alpha-sialidase [Caldilineaceae bacterium]